MLRVLVKTLSNDTNACDKESLDNRLHAQIEARDAITAMIEKDFSGDVRSCHPLDNFAQAVLRHPARVIKKWRLEFVRLCDFSRVLVVHEGAENNKGFRFSASITVLQYHSDSMARLGMILQFHT